MKVAGSAPFTLLASLAGAASALDTYYVAFYPNVDCSGDEIGTTQFSITNGGCFTVPGAKCMKYAGGSGGPLYYPPLTAYSKPGCNDGDETGCNTLITDSFDKVGFAGITAWAADAGSYRFPQGAPPTCPNNCVGECPGGHAPTKKRDSPKANDYAFYTSSDCSGKPGGSIEPSNGDGCLQEGDRGSIYSNSGAKVTFDTFRTQNQTCDGTKFGTFVAQPNACTTLKRFADGGPNAYLQTGWGG